ncbi:MAG: glycosyltransferase family 2 protein [Deltaproteobacteria bacterium]|nr:glycosyltransferase family 2 protein [Deltaproteobacteria bacterium]
MLISVVIPTFNRMGMVLRALDSVLCQSYREIEVLVVDDGSTDETERWVNRCADPRIKYIKTPNRGVSSARNYGVDRSCGEWVCFLDSDDLWHRHKLTEQVRHHQENPDSLVSQTNDIWIRDSKRVNKMKKHAQIGGMIFKESLRRCMITCSTLMIKKKYFEGLGRFDESMPVCEDYDLGLRIARTHPVALIDKPLATKFGGHEGQLSKKLPVMDEYRVYALNKLLRSGVLDDEQTEMVLSEIQYKNAIINQGRRKRGCGPAQDS